MLPSAASAADPAGADAPSQALPASSSSPSVGDALDEPAGDGEDEPPSASAAPSARDVEQRETLDEVARVKQATEHTLALIATLKGQLDEKRRQANACASVAPPPRNARAVGLGSGTSASGPASAPPPAPALAQVLALGEERQRLREAAAASSRSSDTTAADAESKRRKSRALSAAASSDATPEPFSEAAASGSSSEDDGAADHEDDFAPSGPTRRFHWKAITPHEARNSGWPSLRALAVVPPSQEQIEALFLLPDAEVRASQRQAEIAKRVGQQGVAAEQAQKALGAGASAVLMQEVARLAQKKGSAFGVAPSATTERLQRIQDRREERERNVTNFQSKLKVARLEWRRAQRMVGKLERELASLDAQIELAMKKKKQKQAMATKKVYASAPIPVVAAAAPATAAAAPLPVRASPAAAAVPIPAAAAVIPRAGAPAAIPPPAAPPVAPRIALPAAPAPAPAASSSAASSGGDRSALLAALQARGGARSTTSSAIAAAEEAHRIRHVDEGAFSALKAGIELQSSQLRAAGSSGRSYDRYRGPVATEFGLTHSQFEEWLAIPASASQGKERHRYFEGALGPAIQSAADVACSGFPSALVSLLLEFVGSPWEPKPADLVPLVGAKRAASIEIGVAAFKGNVTTPARAGIALRLEAALGAPGPRRSRGLSAAAAPGRMRSQGGRGVDPAVCAMIRAAMTSMDAERLSLSQIESLIELLPSKAEARVLEEYELYMVDVGSARRLWDSVACFRQPSASARLQAWEFCLKFERQFSTTQGAVQRALAAAHVVLEGPALQHALATVLAVGNFLNYGSVRGSARGFRLSSLQQLAVTRGVDNKNNLAKLLVTHWQQQKLAAAAPASGSCWEALLAELSVCQQVDEDSRSLSKALAAILRSLRVAETALAVGKFDADDAFPRVVAPLVAAIVPRVRELEAQVAELRALSDRMVAMYPVEEGVLREYAGQLGHTGSWAYFTDVLSKWGRSLTQTDTAIRQEKQRQEDAAKVKQHTVKMSSMAKSFPRTYVKPKVLPGLTPGARAAPNVGRAAAAAAVARALALPRPQVRKSIPT